MNTSITKNTTTLFKKSGNKLQHTASSEKESIAHKAFLWLTVFLLSGYLLTHPSLSFTAINNALIFCFKTLIPSLFPFMIAGEVLILSGFPLICDKYLGKLFNRVFGISGKGAAAFIIGAFCGFPVGAKTAVMLYTSGEVDKKEAERLSGICNNGGIGFLISGIGIGIWQSPAFGIALYFSQLISAAIAGILLFGTRKKTFASSSINCKDTSPEKTFSVSETVSTAISTAVLSMLRITGFVVFFEVLLSALSSILSYVGAGLLSTCLLSAFTEITAGAKALKLLSTIPSYSWSLLAKILTFTISAWGGLSVYMQFCAFAFPSGISTRSYLKSKLTQSLICTLIGTLLVLFRVV